jgi:hypothetical protein
MKNQSKYFFLILVLILVVGLVLRYWKFWEIPFTYDELSALSRLQFDNLSSLLKFGVKPDGHPAGVHVFLYYWIKLFGDGETVVKLPFLLAGLASIYLVYRIGLLWFNNTVGILSAVYISSLQLTVMFSQIARPYISGLFLTLMMVLYWSRYFFNGCKTRNLVGFVIFASLSTYNHHFSLLFAAIVGISGLWFVNAKNRLLYLFSGIVIFVLYIPHLPIFYSQLIQGGIGGVGGWLNKPGPFFLFEFLDWLFHFCTVVWMVLLVVWLYGIYAEGDMTQPNDAAKKRKILLLWFFLPLIIGYLYSVLINPVLQYSMLIFSTPYLFILFFSPVKNIAAHKALLLVVLVLFVNIISLVWVRDYYKLFYNQPYERAVKNANKLDLLQFKDEVFLIDDYIPFYNEYYLEKYNSNTPYFTTRNKDLTIADFKDVLKNIDKNVLVASGLKVDYFQLIKEKFPHLLRYNQGLTYEEYIFSKTLPEGEKELTYNVVAATNFKYELRDCEIKEKYVEIDSIDDLSVFHLKPELKYGPFINIPLEEITDSRYLFIDFHLEVQLQGEKEEAAVVVILKKGEATLWWKSVTFSEFEPKKGEWTNVYLTMDLMTAIGQKEEIEGCEFKTFIWNPESSDYLIRLYKITSRPGNPYRYGLIYNFED